MQENELEKALRSVLASPNAPEPSDAAIDTILASGQGASPESLFRIRRRFTEMLFQEKYPEPMRSLEKGTTFGDFLETRRNEIGLRLSDVASALEVEDRALEDLEKGRTSPWKIPPALGGRIIGLFRVHMDALSRLVASSLAVSSSSGLQQVQARSSQRDHSSSRGDSASRALERFLAREAEEPGPDAEVDLWLGEVVNTVKAAGLSELVDK